jgi:hypothetical protein
MAKLPTIVSFWHGPLTWLERLCITSFVRQGHPFHLYTYEEVADLPKGAKRMDAETIIPRDQMFFYKGKHTPAVFADLFRLKLMQQGAGIWADCDVYAVRPFADLGDYVFGYEIAPDAKGKGGSVNNAIFACPSDSPLLEKLLAVFGPQSHTMPMPWLPPLRRAELALRRMLGQKLAPSDIQFGATGPFPLTWFVRELGLQQHIQPVDVFYPVPYTAIPTLMQPDSTIEQFTSANTLGVHIWRSQLTQRGRTGIATPPPDSAMALLCERDGIDTKA